MYSIYTKSLQSDSPLAQNPSLIQKNLTALLFQWSPPYLWPGHSIQSYNVSIQSHDNNYIIYHHINATFDDRLVEFTFVQEEQENYTDCSEFTFGISAFSTDSQELSANYITGGYASSNHNINLMR